MDFQEANNLLRDVKYLYEIGDFRGKNELIKITLEKLESFFTNKESEKIAENVRKCFLKHNTEKKDYKTASKSHSFASYKGYQIPRRQSKSFL